MTQKLLIGNKVIGDTLIYLGHQCNLLTYELNSETT